MLVLLLSALAFGAQLIYDKLFFSTLILGMYTNCENFTVPMVGDIKDAYYANGVGVILDGDTVKAYLILGKDKDEWKVLLEKEVGWSFKEVATDGKLVYVCGDECEALDLKGNLLWSIPVAFDGSHSNVAISGRLLIVPNEEKGEIYFIKGGKLIKVISKRFESIDFCGKYYALISNKTLEVGEIPTMKVLWTKEGAWSPYEVKFAYNCKAVGVNTLTSIYVYDTESGHKIDVVSADGGFFTTFSVCKVKDAWVLLAINAPYTALSYPFDEHLLTFEGYLLGK